MIAIIDPTGRFKKHFNYTDFYSNITDLIDRDFQKYKAIIINGNTNSIPMQLPYNFVAKLWQFVEQGGLLYGEMINCEDFPTSRLFGFKQEFSPSIPRRLEKLKIARQNSFCKKGSLLEWGGSYLTGFHFVGELLLELDIFKETHQTEKVGKFPGIISRKLGKGMILFSAFSLFGTEETWTLRPNWLWNELFNWLKNEYGLPIKGLQPDISTMNTNLVEQTISNSLRWFLNSGIMPKTDGTQGIYENVHSLRSDISEDIRPDCNAHSALMFYLLGEYFREPKWHEVSKNILRYLFDSGFQDTNPNSPSYGFWKWYKFPGKTPDQIFTDDNSWVAFILLYLYRKTGNEEYKKRGLMTAYSLLRTQNKLGLRPECIRGYELCTKGIAYFQESQECSMNPHFESIAHAALIQAFLVSKDKDFLHAAQKGTNYLLDHIDQLKFMYSKTAGYSRFLLALAYLYAITNEEKYYNGIKTVINYLESHQHESGGIQEADNPDPERYWAEDTGVFLYNGEEIGDQLYTNNFLIMNSWEAWKATHDPEILQFHNKLVDYICKIQIKSHKKEFHGGWMRAFHLGRNEYFGNNGDTGWGAYCIESGWTSALITAGLLLRELDWSLVKN